MLRDFLALEMGIFSKTNQVLQVACFPVTFVLSDTQLCSKHIVFPRSPMSAGIPGLEGKCIGMLGRIFSQNTINHADKITGIIRCLNHRFRRASP